MSDQSLGSCLCGQVKFQIRGPFLAFQYCHCSRCQKNSGSAHAANILLVRDQFEWLAGEEGVRQYELPEAKYYCTAFCTNCGSAMPWLSRTGKAYLVPAGALDEAPEAKPNRNIYLGSRPAWYEPVASLESFDTYPGKS